MGLNSPISRVHYPTALSPTGLRQFPKVIGLLLLISSKGRGWGMDTKKERKRAGEEKGGGRRERKGRAITRKISFISLIASVSEQLTTGKGRRSHQLAEESERGTL